MQEAPEVVADVPEYTADLLQPHRYKVLYGGRGGTKSWTVARVLLAKGNERPLRILCAREIQNSIKDSVHLILRDQSEAMGLPYEATEQEIRHPNGTVFFFTGVRTNPRRVKSMEGIDVCWVEEAERVSKESWDILLPTIRKAGSEVWVTFNPDLEDDATYRMFITDPLPGTWSKHVGSEDNPWLSDELKQLRAHAYRTDPDAADNIWGGNPRQATDAQILKGKWIIEEFDPGSEWDGPYYGADWGFAQDPSALVECWIRQNTLYLYRESYQIGLELDDTADRWERDVPGSAAHVVRADSARPESISFLRRHGYPRIEPVHKWDGSVKDGIAHLRQYDRIVIHPRCVNAAAEAKHYKYKVNRAGDVLTEVVDKWNHIWDATRYALAPLIRQRKKIERREIPGSSVRSYV